MQLHGKWAFFDYANEFLHYFLKIKTPLNFFQKCMYGFTNDYFRLPEEMFLLFLFIISTKLYTIIQKLQNCF